MKMTFPMPPNLTNAGSRSHWKIKGREKKAYLKVCDERQNCGLLPAPPKMPHASIELSSVMHLGSAMDDDNALARHKWPLDWLKTRGFIVDDRRQNIKWLSLPEQVVKRDGNYSIEITLAAVESK